MVIFYNTETKEIIRTEDNVLIPTLPMIDDKIKFYQDKGEGIISLPYELGYEIFKYNLVFDNEGIFLGLQPKE